MLLRSGLGLGALQVVGLAKREKDGVGVLFDVPGLTQIGQTRPLVVPPLDLAGQLGRSDHTGASLSGQPVKPARDVSPQGGVVPPLGRGQDDLLKVVDEDRAQVGVAPAHGPDLPLNVLKRHAGRVVDQDIGRDAAAIGLQPGHIHGAQATLADVLIRDPVAVLVGDFGQGPLDQFPLRHFQRQDQKGPPRVHPGGAESGGPQQGALAH